MPVVHSYEAKPKAAGNTTPRGTALFDDDDDDDSMFGKKVSPKKAISRQSI